MKKFRFILFVAFVSVLTFGSCKKADAQSSESTPGKALKVSSYSEDKPVYKERNSLQLNTNSENLVDFQSVKNFSYNSFFFSIITYFKTIIQS